MTNENQAYSIAFPPKGSVPKWIQKEKNIIDNATRKLLQLKNSFSESYLLKKTIQFGPN